MTRLLGCLLLAFALPVSAVVIRHDVDDAKYRVPDSEFPALVDMPHEGHGVLVAPQWIVTAAHTTTWHPIEELMLNGQCRKVERVIVHAGYKPLPKELQSGDAAPVVKFLGAIDDIALIKLADPVTDVAPVPLYRANDELGKRVEFIGKGATGNGAEGQVPHGAHRTQLRRAFNTVSRVEDRWLGYVFDSGKSALPLEGTTGNGDSGGPVLIEVKGDWQLAGLASYVGGGKYRDKGTLAGFQPGHYGQLTYQVRISHYIPWIEATLASDQADGK